MKEQRMTVEDFVNEAPNHMVIEIRRDGVWYEIDHIEPAGIHEGLLGTGEVVIETEYHQWTYKTSDFITVRWDVSDTETQEVAIVSDDHPTPPTLATMTWDDLEIKIATNGWFDELRFYSNTITFLKDGEIVIELARPTRHDTSYWLMNQVAHQLPEIANTPKSLKDIPF